MNFNNQSCNCGNLAHVYGVSQCSIIMEIMICKSSVSLLVLLLSFSSVFITLHDKHHFIKICNSVKMKKTTHTWKCILPVIFFVIWGILQMIAVIVVICITVDRFFTTCKFFSVDLQLLPICVQNWVVPSVLNTAHRVLSMTVNHLHNMFCEKDIQRTCLCW